MKGLRGDNYSTKLFLLLICLSLMLWFCGEQVLSQSRETLTRTFYIDDSLTGDSTNNCTVLEEPCNITRAETIFVNEFNSLNFTTTPSIFIYFNIISDTFDCLTKLPKYDSNKIYYLHLVFQSFNNKNEKTNLVCNDGYVFNNDNVHVQLDNVKITTPLFQVDECNFICNYCDFHSTSIISNNGYLRFINTVFDGSYIQIKNSASTDFKGSTLTSSTSFLLEEILYLNIQDSTFDNLGSTTKIQGVRSFDMSNCDFNGTSSFYTISVRFSFYVTIVNVNVLNRFTIFNFGNIFSITMENITFTGSQTGTEAVLVISETRNAKLTNLNYEKLSATCLSLKNVNEAELFQSKFNSTTRTGISTTKTTLKIHQSDFIENKSGAIITDSESHLEINNCNFIRNYAFSHGGAIFSRSSTQIVIKNSKFIENKVIYNKIDFCGRRMTTTEKNCEGSGGAIYAVGLSISNCEFYGNSAVRGGAIFLESTVFDFGNNSFIKNTALFSGGAIFNLRPAESTKGNSFYVSDNSALVYGNDFATSLLKANWTTTASIREDDGVTNLLVYPGQLFSLHFDAIDSVGNHIPVLKEKKQLTAVEYASAQTNFTLSTEAMIDTPTGIENIVVIQKGSEKLSENKRFALVIQFSSNFVFIIVDVIDCPKGNEMKQISFSANEFACLPKEKDKTIVIIASTVVGSIIGIVIGIIITYGVYKLLKRLRKLARKERAEKEMEQKLLAHQFSNSGEYYTNTVQLSSSTSLKQRMSLNTPLSQDLNYIIPVEELELKRKLGEGGNGTVFLANFHSNQVAVKLLHSKVMNDDEDNTYEREMFERECLLLNTLRHPNIVNFYGVCLTEENRYMVVEYMPKGSLDKIILSCKLGREHLTFKQKLKILYDVSSGMKYLHNLTPPIIHRDLKLANILMNENGDCKVCDFGLSRIVNVKQSTLTTNIGTLFYMSNEMILGSDFWKDYTTYNERNYSTKSDVYSFAIIMYELFFEENPYLGHNAEKMNYFDNELMSENNENALNVNNAFSIPLLVIKGVRPKIPFMNRSQLEIWLEKYLFSQEKYSEKQKQYIVSVVDEYVTLMKACWSALPWERPDFVEITKAVSKWSSNLF